MLWNWLSLFQTWHNIAYMCFDKPIKAEPPSIKMLSFATFMREEALS